MAEPLVSDVLWEQIQPLLPPHRPSPKGGRRPADDRKCLQGIIFVLKTGCQWQQLPKCESWPSGSTCWRRFSKWTQAGVWPQVHRKLLNILGKAGEIDLTVVIVDSASVRALKGGLQADPTLPIARKKGANGTSSANARACRS